MNRLSISSYILAEVINTRQLCVVLVASFGLINPFFYPVLTLSPFLFNIIRFPIPRTTKMPYKRQQTLHLHMPIHTPYYQPQYPSTIYSVLIFLLPSSTSSKYWHSIHPSATSRLRPLSLSLLTPVLSIEYSITVLEAWSPCLLLVTHLRVHYDYGHCDSRLRWLRQDWYSDITYYKL
jgi:hypothetical protein